MNHWLMSLTVLFASVASADETPLVHLQEGGFGQVREWELRLERDGRVVEERWDLASRTVEGIHVETVVRTIPLGELKSIVERATGLAAPLPAYIDDDSKILLDEETRSIRIAGARVAKFSGWAGYARKRSTATSRRFMQAWHALDALVRRGNP